MKLFLKIFGIVLVIAIIVLIVHYAVKGRIQPGTPSGEPTIGQVANIPNTLEFADTTHGFSFSYPVDLGVVAPFATSYSTTWRQNTQTNGLTFVTGTLDKSFQSNTNFSEGKFTIGESNDPAAVTACLTAQNGESAAGPVTINGVAFSKFTLGDAGAGNLYDTTSYRTLYNGRCFALEYTIHSTNIGNYDPSQGIKQFDANAVKAKLEIPVQSFVFKKAPDSAALIGTWTGVEGTSLAISTDKTGSGYDLKFVTLDGPLTLKGKPNGDGISFTRDSKTYTLFHGTGNDTGMKYLPGKTDCVVVMPYEGYCKS
ncbi:MAG: hypothetical protein JWM20_19 [Patescibacteria group bacterium]|nr:hypothetical protein [Patescibacteria group bacterium]